MPHLYFYLEDLNLTAAQRQTLVDTVKAYGLENSASQPARRNHWRVRLDNKAVIFEGVFPDSQLTAAHFQQVLANIYNVAPASITFAATQTAYGPLVTYTYNSQARLRMGVFASVAAAWEQSRQAAQAYIFANLAAWES